MSEIIVRLQNIKKPTAMDVINFTKELSADCSAIGYYLPSLVTSGRVEFTARQKKRMINLLERTIVKYAKHHKWSEVRALVRMLEAVE